ncbi:hypothetical protein NKJ04_17595 [Mesorhizobium sp. M0618]|uniref:hypothetical protein n=1 Tax=Mesorhizobium sp. M0618 TaxID=2956972 RepID=UPI0033389F72
MQIILTNSEIESALRETILSQITIREDQKIHIRIEETDDNGHIAVIDVLKAGDEPSSGTGGGTKGTDTAKPKGTRTKKPAVAAEAPAASQAADSTEETTEEVVETAESLGTVSEQTAAVVDTKPPFDVDEPETTQPNEVPAPVAMKIFPDLTSSAAPATPKPAVDPAVAAKSLFANLTKPTQ